VCDTAVEELSLPKAISIGFTPNAMQNAPNVKRKPVTRASHKSFVLLETCCSRRALTPGKMTSKRSKFVTARSVITYAAFQQLASDKIVIDEIKVEISNFGQLVGFPSRLTG